MGDITFQINQGGSTHKCDKGLLIAAYVKLNLKKTFSAKQFHFIV